METAKKNIWTIISTVISLLGLVFVIAECIGKPVRDLVITADPPASVVTVNVETGADIAVMLNGEPVENLSIIKAHIRNNGNQPILVDDFYRPITFRYPDKFADVAVLSTLPVNLGVEVVRPHDNEAQITPMLLNPKDEITLQLMVLRPATQQTTDALEVDGRIAGINQLEITRPAEGDARNPLLIAIFVSAAGSLAIATINYYKSKKRQKALANELEKITVILNNQEVLDSFRNKRDQHPAMSRLAVNDPEIMKFFEEEVVRYMNIRAEAEKLRRRDAQGEGKLLQKAKEELLKKRLDEQLKNPKDPNDPKSHQ